MVSAVVPPFERPVIKVGCNAGTPHAGTAVSGNQHKVVRIEYWSIYEVSDYLGCGSYGSRVVPEVECTS